MKKILLFLMLALFCIPWAANAQNRTVVTIGDGTSTQRYPLPGYYGYQYDVYLYTPSAVPALDADCDISSIAFNVTTNNTDGESTMEIWVKDVDANYALAVETTFADYTADADLVYENEDFTSTTGWNTLAFTQDFSHQGGKALLVAVRGVGCGTTACSRYCTYTSVSNTTWYKHQDNTDPGANASGSVGGSRANIQLDLTYTGAICLSPSGLAASNVTDNSATLNWNENGEATAWVLQYGTDSEFGTYTEETVSATPSFGLTGLTALTTYYARVKPDCDADGSHWSNTVTFTTTAVATVVGDGWSDDFEGASFGWELINGTLTNQWAWGTAANNGGTHGLYISNDGGTSNAYSHSAAIVYATKLLNFTEGKYEFSYDWKANGESSYDYLRVALVPASVTLTAGTIPSGFSTTGLPSGWIALDGGSKLNLVTAWQSKSLAINVTAGNYYLVMAWRNDGGGGTQPPAAVDNVSITKMACPYDVAGLAVSENSITTTGANLTWTAGEATQWQVAYANNTAFENATEEIVSAATYSITGLNASTVYYVKVRAYCDGEDFGSWSNVLSFTTACGVLTEFPYSVNFDNVSGTTSGSTNNLPNCWAYINECTYSYYTGYPVVYNSSTYSNSGNNHLRFYSYIYAGSSTNYDPQDQYAILPEMQGLNGKRIKLYARANNTGAAYDATFHVGIMTNPEDESTFTEVASYTPTTTTYELYTIPFNTYTGNGTYIAIKMDAAVEPESGASYHSVYIDDITVEEIPNCLEPTALDADNITTNSAELSWTAGSTETTWTVYYKKAADENYTEVANATNPYTLNGLDAATSYQYYVVANCSATDASEASEVFSFTTACGTITTLPWSENFNSYTGSTSTSVPTGFPNDQLPNCWQFLNRSESSSNYPLVFISSYSGYPVSGNCLFFRSSNTTPLYAILPDFEEEIAGLQLTFTYRNEGVSTYNGTLIVGYMTNPADTTTFTEVLTCDQTTTRTEKEVLFTGAPDGSYIAFKYQGGLNDNYYLGIDDVSIDYAPACPKPTSLAVTSNSVTAHGATITWTPGAEETSWIVEYDTNANFTHVLEESVNTDPTYTFQGLAPVTTYYVRVKADCGAEIVSQTSNVVNFTTTVACPVPTNLTTPVVSGHYARLNWNENGSATNWVVAYKATADEEFTEVGVSRGSTDSSYYYFENLQPLTEYTVKVKADCGGIDGASDWSSTKTFTTLEACPAPQGLSASAIAGEATQYKLDWYAGEATSWVLQYSTDNTFATEVQTVSVSNIPPTATLTGLTPATVYYARVKGDCGDDGESAWSNYVSFTTPCAAVTTFPWTENFNSLTAGIPNCWDNSEGTTTSASSKWSYYDTGHEGVGLRFNSYYNSNGNTNFLKTPVMNLPASPNMQLTFWYKNPTGGDFSVYISTDGGTTHETALATGLTGVSEWTEHTAINLSAYAGQEIVVVFKGTSNYGNGDAYIYLDDVTIDEIPACPAPTDLTYSINVGGVTVGWNGTSDSYNVQLGVNNPVVLFSADFADGIPTDMTNDDTYPWTVVDGYIKSGNAGVGSSTSEISVTYTYPADGVIEFDAECKGEGATTIYDHCDFYIDGTRKLYAGANISGWNHYIFDVPAGEHTFVWSYTKDSSVNPTGDYFAIDNVVLNKANVTWNDAIPTTENSNDFTISQAGEYWVHVQGVCDGETGDWSSPLVFDFTPVNCEAGIVLNAANPTWSENFDNMTNIANVANPFTGVTPLCWTWTNLVAEEVPGHPTVAADTATQVYYNSAYAHSGSYSLRSHFRGITAMPELVLDEGVDMRSVKMSFWYRQPHWFYPMQVGVMTDPSDPSTFVPVAYVNNGNSTAVTKFEFDFSNYTGEGRYIAFKHFVPDATSLDIHGVNYIDDITLELIEPVTECPTVALDETIGFEGITTLVNGATGVSPRCWEVVSGTPTVVPQLYHKAAYAHNSSYSLRMVDRCVYAMPELAEGITLNNVQMEFYVRQANVVYQLEVGVWDGSKFEPVALINNSDVEVTKATVKFTGYPGTSGRIAFRNTLQQGVDYPYSYNYIDDITLTAVEPVDCSAGMTLPYSENFDNYTSSALAATGIEPDCWEVVDGTPAVSPQLYCKAAYANNGNYSLRMSDLCVYAMPELPSTVTSFAGLSMTMYVRQPYAVYQLEVGVWDAASSTFTSIATINNPDDAVTPATVDLSSYEGFGRIAFRNTLQEGINYSYSYNYIDNIEISTAKNAIASDGNVMYGDEMESERYLDNIAVYPNPTTGVLHIDAVDVQKVECYNQMGQLVGVYDNVNELNISELAEGVYMLRITVPQGVTMRKVVKR